MKRIDVPLGEHSYPILIGAGLLDQSGIYLRPYARHGRLIVVSDNNVWNALGDRFSAGLDAGEIKACPILLPPGEENKSWAALIALADRLLEFNVERQDYIVALGGGVIGDLTGFAAAILKRGCSYVQIPTSLLAQVDSSVGGKTAINAASGKNLIGAFHQPTAVLIDPSTLTSLAKRQLCAGYAETVKYGLINDYDFFVWCELHGEDLLSGDIEARLYAIETSVRAKIALVAKDVRETNGHRALLNLGHSFGHALEAETGFSDQLLHGEAIALGMVLAFRFSAGRGLCPIEDAGRVAAHLGAMGLPITMAEAGIACDGKSLIAHMAQDKKRKKGRLPFILTRGIGKSFIDQGVDIMDVEKFLDRECGR